MGFALCEHELCGDCTISTAVVCVVLLYVCVGWLTCHASGLPRGFHSVAGAVYCSLPEFVHTLPFFFSALIYLCKWFHEVVPTFAWFVLAFLFL